MKPNLKSRTRRVRELVAIRRLAWVALLLGLGWSGPGCDIAPATIDAAGSPDESDGENPHPSEEVAPCDPAVLDHVVVNEEFTTGVRRFALTGGDWAAQDGELTVNDPVDTRPIDNLAVHGTALFGDFILTAKARVPDETDWDDFGIVLAHQATDDFVHVNLNEQNDETCSGIFEHSSAGAVELEDIPIALVAGVDHELRVEARGGELHVLLDGVTVGEVSGLDTTGRVGLGTVNNGPFFDDLVVYSHACDSEKPSVPTKLVVAITGVGSAAISWSPSTDDTTVTGYTVRRDGTALGDMPTISTSVRESGLATGSYSYTVEAHDAFGHTSELSAPVIVSVEPSLGTATPTITPSDGSVDVSNRTTIQMTFGSMTELAMAYEVITVTANGNPIAGAWTDDGVNHATFSLPAGQVWPARATVAISPPDTDVGSVRRADESLAAVQLGSWSVTIGAGVSYPAPKYFSEDFESPNLHAGLKYTWKKNVTREGGVAARSGNYGVKFSVKKGQHWGGTIYFEHSNLVEVWTRYYIRFGPNWKRDDTRIGKAGFRARSSQSCKAPCLEMTDSHEQTSDFRMIKGYSYWHRNVTDDDYESRRSITATSAKYTRRDWQGGERKRGQWYCVETRHRLTTPKMGNGIYQNWLDGTLVSDVRNANQRDSATFDIDRSVLIVYVGGNWVADQDMNVYFDDWAVSDQRIGCN